MKNNTHPQKIDLSTSTKHHNHHIIKSTTMSNDVIRTITRYTPLPSLISLFKTHALNYTIKFTYYLEHDEHTFHNISFLHTIFPNINIIITNETYPLFTNESHERTPFKASSLSLKIQFYLFSTDLKIITTQFPLNLKRITLVFCQNLTDISGFNELPNLRHILLTECTNLQTIPDLSKCTKLKSFAIRHAPLINSITNLQQSTNLRSLTLIGTQPIDVSCFANHKKLKSLILQNPHTDSAYPQHLKKLHLNNPTIHSINKKITKTLKILKLHQFLNSILPPTTSQLREIRLIKCEILSDITSLQTCSSSITKLCIAQNKLLTSESIQILTTCTNLRFLTLHKCSSITNIPPITTLKYIDLSECKKITEFHGWQGLIDVRLTYCSFLNTLENLPSCKALDIHGCSSLNHFTIIQKYPNIKHYNIDGIESCKLDYVKQFDDEYDYYYNFNYN